MTPPVFLRAQNERAETLLESVRAYYAFDGITFESNSVRAECARGRGLGSAVLGFMQERLTAVGIHTLELQAKNDNIEARRFCERAGFAAETRIPFAKRCQQVQ